MYTRPLLEEPGALEPFRHEESHSDIEVELAWGNTRGLACALEAGLLGDGVHAVEADEVQVLPHDELLQRAVPPQYNTTPRQCHAGFIAQSFTNYGAELCGEQKHSDFVRYGTSYRFF